MQGSGQIGLGFSSQRRRILLILKRRRVSSLGELAGELSISKVATLRHLARLESDGLIEREYRAEGVGRPKVRFSLTSKTRTLFPEAYAQMSVCALNFIERSQGRTGVVQLLQERAHEIEDQHRGEMDNGALSARVAVLARVRDQGGYMAEVGARKGTSVEMLEHNCPILAIAAQYPEACEVERQMFQRMLKARVQTEHRVAAGDPVCRFLIRPDPINTT